MDSIISTFHIDWHLMLAQLFVFKPLNKVMADRGERIDRSLKEAEEISAKLKSAEEEKIEVLNEGRQQAQKIIQESKLLAENSQKKTIEETQEKVKKIVEESKKQIASGKQQMIKEVESHVVDLAILVSQQVLQKVTDKKIDKSLAT